MIEVATGIQVFDDVLSYPVMYRSQALELEYKSVETGAEMFHGIGDPGNMKSLLPREILSRLPHLVSTLTFFRKSPYEQSEPNFIHTDESMGDFTGILYLNEDPPKSDGTTFWRHRATRLIESVNGFDGKEDWKHTEKWEPWNHVKAAFNRLLIFPATYFHSRAIHDNYGQGNDARLIQVVFGTGSLKGL